MVGSDHFHQLWLDNMPQFLVGNAEQYDAQLVQRGARVRPAADAPAGRPGPVRAHPAQRPGRRLRPRVQQRAADRPQRHLPDHHAAARRPTCRSCRSTRTSSRRRCRSRSGSSSWARLLRELVESWPSDQRVAIIGTGHLSLELGGPRQFGPHGPDPEFDAQGGRVDRQRRPGRLPGRGDARQPARAGQRHPRLHGLHADDGRGRRGREGRLRRHATTCSTRWRRTSPGTRTERRHEQVPGDKFLFTVDRDPELVERYREDPRGTVAWWEAERANLILNCHAGESSTWLAFTDAEREALATHDYPALFELGAHPFLTLTLFIAMFERDYDEPLGFQLEYARRLAHFSLPVRRHQHLSRGAAAPHRTGSRRRSADARPAGAGRRPVPGRG